MSGEKRKRILIATTSASAPLLAAILDDQYQLTFSQSIEHASSQMDEDLALIACDTHFDDCRMFDLLRISKSNPASRTIPFLCLRVVEGALDRTLYQSVDIASSALGAAAFIDLFDLKHNLGDDQAHRKLNSVIALLASRNSEL